MKPKLIGLGCLLFLAIPLIAWMMTDDFAERYGPLRSVYSQCLLCDGHRHEKWLGERKTIDVIEETEQSLWVDTLYPAGHEHIWQSSTTFERARWFGSGELGCGGIPTIATIYHNKPFLGDKAAEELLAEVHSIVLDKTISAKSRWTSLRGVAVRVADQTTPKAASR